MSELQRQIVDVERQKQMIHEYLFSNNEAVSRVQREVTRSASGKCALIHIRRTPLATRKSCVSTCTLLKIELNTARGKCKNAIRFPFLVII